MEGGQREGEARHREAISEKVREEGVGIQMQQSDRIIY